ncbi:L,D-transpeptidase family protein [Sphingomonas sp. HDW15A]|uniref:L,D-transpeptidase family protein n=1 Tax=Sphingomonas sp. HDW15A TaxID=2714942 RepID=UPI0014090A3A|nr:L,D-transpeptidase family protein [Sphingomonas sp. HDW15A]QIK95172.1 L,D-transpeptidase family protein [Sphingomonas sp. HDW15A]
MLAAFAVVVAQAPLASTASAYVAAEVAAPSIESFYATRGGRLIWFGPTLTDTSAATAFIELLRSADADGLNPQSYPIAALEDAIRGLQAKDFPSIARADRLFSEVLVRFARDLRRDSTGEMIWVDQSLRPAAASPEKLLNDFASAGSQREYIAEMRWMNPVYVGLRDALLSGGQKSGQDQVLRLNLERARVLPMPIGRYLIVNASAARLTLYDGAREVDSMKVVVGKRTQATPMMAAFIRYTSLNPYWNVPPDLTAERIAPNVVKEGLSYLEKKGYQVLSSWGDDARILDPATIDWQTVADGRAEIRVRQLPGPENAMGQMKFMFPNSQGVYLHDTPQKELLAEASRMFSGGCVRLEDAPRLARWLHGRALEPSGAAPEQHVDMKDPVPVFITYLTAVPEEGKIAYYRDVYGRDAQALAKLGTGSTLASRH